MANLTTSLDDVKNAIVELHEQMAALDPNSEMHDKLFDETSVLIKRRKMLENYDSERTVQIDGINKDIDDRLKKVTEELEDERKERVANVNFDYENKIKQLPKLSCPIESYLSTEVGTAKLVVQHMQRYTIDFKDVPEERNFFHAAACSHLQKYVSTKYEVRFDKLNNDLWSAANLPNDTKYPLTLADVDRIIHLPSYNEHILVVLDTSLRVILTNAGYSEEHKYPFLVVYDSITHKFAPISQLNKNNKDFCKKCFRYKWNPCPCQGQLCPICLRTGDDVKCSKPSSESKFQICAKCNAHCQTDDCFQTHQKVCPRPVSGLHDDIVEILRSIAV